MILDGVEPIDHEMAISWTDFLEMGKDVEDSEVHSRIDGIEPDDLAALIYTSGTTGNPKGSCSLMTTGMLSSPRLTG